MTKARERVAHVAAAVEVGTCRWRACDRSHSWRTWLLPDERRDHPGPCRRVRELPRVGRPARRAATAAARQGASRHQRHHTEQRLGPCGGGCRGAARRWCNWSPAVGHERDQRLQLSGGEVDGKMTARHLVDPRPHGAHRAMLPAGRRNRPRRAYRPSRRRLRRRARSAASRRRPEAGLFLVDHGCSVRGGGSIVIRRAPVLDQVAHHPVRPLRGPDARAPDPEDDRRMAVPRLELLVGTGSGPQPPRLDIVR